MSQSARSGVATVIAFAFCILLAADIAVRLFDASPVEATRITGRETDAAINQLSGTYSQMAAANQNLAASINRLSSELSRLQLDKWAKAENELAKAQEKLAAAAEGLANSIVNPAAMDSRGALPSEGSGETGTEN